MGHGRATGLFLAVLGAGCGTSFSPEEHRNQVIESGATLIEAVGSYLYYDVPNGETHSLRRTSSDRSTKLTYAFSTGDETRMSSSLVVTAEGLSGADSVYTAYSAESENSLVSAVTIAPPTDSSKWHPFSVSGADVYIAQIEASDVSLLKWVPSQGTSTTKVMSLQSALKAAGLTTMGQFQGMGVHDGYLVFVEGGRVWSLNLSTGTATWLKNRSAVQWDTPVSFDSSGVLYPTEDSPYYYRFSDGSLLDVGAAIGINSLFFTYQDFEYDAVLYKNYVIYVGKEYGVHGFDMDKKKLTTILSQVQPVDGSGGYGYRHPYVTEDGVLFVECIKIADNSVGGDCGIYSVNLSSVLD